MTGAGARAAARPGLTPALITKLIAEVADHPAGGLLALPVVDTVKRAGPGSLSAQTVPRDGLVAGADAGAVFLRLAAPGLCPKRPIRKRSRTTPAPSKRWAWRPGWSKATRATWKVTLPRDIHTAELYLAHPES